MEIGSRVPRPCCSSHAGSLYKGFTSTQCRRPACGCKGFCQQHQHAVLKLKHLTWQKQRFVGCPVFGWLRGRQEQSELPAEVHGVVSEGDLPFPIDILDNTHLRGRQLARAYRATEHGWGALQFHKLCDMKGPCVIYCETEQGARFGGFNSEGFKSSDDYSSSSKAFLFCWKASDKEPTVLGKVGGTEAALFDYARGGPQWGADALIIGPPQVITLFDLQFTPLMSEPHQL
ncbi:hypothetical protein ABBQ32_001302 [Trebouxia sp. C0010 RCD-2024]